MKLKFNGKAYRPRGWSGVVGSILMLPMMLSMFAVMLLLIPLIICIFLLAGPGVAIMMIQAERTPLEDDKEEKKK